MPKITASLTQKTITAAISARKGVERVTLRDGLCPGLIFSAGPLGCKWSLQAVVGPEKKRKFVQLGSYPTLSLPDARKMAADKREELSRYDPSATPTNRISESLTLSKIVSLYGELNGVTLRSWYDQNNRIKRVFADMMETPLDTLTELDFQKAIDDYPTKSSAAATVRYIRPLLRWANRRGHWAHTGRNLEAPRGTSKIRERVLSDKELRAIFSALKSSSYDTAIKLLFLSACRRSDVSDMRWEEVDIAQRVWTVPAKRFKSNREHIVPLTDATIELLRTLGPRASGAVFEPALSNWDRYQKQLFKASGTSGWTRHDIRRTVATYLATNNVQPHVIEAILGHALVVSRLASVYNKYRYEKEKREALGVIEGYYRQLIT
jgi:integrase